MEGYDHYLLEVNLDDLENSIGVEQFYWLLQIRSARHEKALRESTRAGVQSECMREATGITFFQINISMLFYKSEKKPWELNLPFYPGGIL